MENSKKRINVMKANKKNKNEKSKAKPQPDLQPDLQPEKSKQQLATKTTQAAGPDSTESNDEAAPEPSTPTPTVLVELAGASDLQKLLESADKKSANEKDTKVGSHSRGLVMLCFSASWCRPCVVFAPQLERIARRFNRVTFAKINVDRLADVADKYKVKAVPTFVLLSGSSKVGTVVAANSAKIEELMIKNGAVPTDEKADTNETEKSAAVKMKTH